MDTLEMEMRATSIFFARIRNDAQLQFRLKDERVTVGIGAMESDSCNTAMVVQKVLNVLRFKNMPKRVTARNGKCFLSFPRCFDFLPQDFEMAIFRHKDSRETSLSFRIFCRAVENVCAKLEIAAFFIARHEKYRFMFYHELVKTAKIPEFKSQLNNLMARYKLNVKNLIGYVTGLLQHFETLYILRMDFCWQVEFLNEITEEVARDTFTCFLNNRRANHAFDHWVGYISKLEFTKNIGHYFHVIICLNIDQNDDYAAIAERIGWYWMNTITSGKGLCLDYGTNFVPGGYITRMRLVEKEIQPIMLYEEYKYSYKLDGTGWLRQTEFHQDAAPLKQVINYLCFKELCFQSKLERGSSRLFSKGALPKQASKKQSRKSLATGGKNA